MLDDKLEQFTRTRFKIDYEQVYVGPSQPALVRKIWHCILQTHATATHTTLLGPPPLYSLHSKQQYLHNMHTPTHAHLPRVTCACVCVWHNRAIMTI